MTRKLQFFLTALLLMVGVTSAWADGPVNLLNTTGSVIKWTPNGGSATTLTYSSGITFTPGNSADFKLEIDFTAFDIDASKAYVIIEASAGALGSATKKVRDITLDGNKFDNGGSNNDMQQTTATVDAATHQVNIFSVLGYNADTKSNPNQTMFEKYIAAGDGNMSFSHIGFNLRGGTTEEITIYRIGLYSIEEIESLYSFGKYRFATGSHRLRMLTEGTDKQVSINASALNNFNLTVDEAAVMFKSLGTLPSTMTAFFRYLTLTDTETAQPRTDDVLAKLKDCVNIAFTAPYYLYFPTMNTNVKVMGYSYKQFKEGTPPSSTPAAVTDGGGSAYTSFTRKFKAGYNTCTLPFNKVQYASLPSGIQVYTFTGFDTEKGEASFTKQTTNSAETSKNIPVIVHADAEGYYMIVGRDPETTFNDYPRAITFNNVSFVGSYCNKVPDGGYAAGTNCVNYGITTDGTKFAKMAGTTTNYYRAFISDQRSGSGVGYAPAYLNVNFGGITGISDIEMKQNVIENENAPIYNLNGVRMNADNLPKGIYIKNGKKFVIK